MRKFERFFGMSRLALQIPSAGGGAETVLDNLIKRDAI